jgi:4-hydroxythreonine-4-phosphate dehydrogenase
LTNTLIRHSAEEQMPKPLVAVTFGDASGIGPELVARLAASAKARDAARLLLVGDDWIWSEGQRIAGVTAAITRVADFAAVRQTDGDILFLPLDTVAQSHVVFAQVTKAAGAGARMALDACLDAAQRGEIDSICFAPLNKQAMKLGGMHFEDELHYFADRLGVTDYFCEFNTLGALWTSRISSHVPLGNVTEYITRERIMAAARLTYATLKRAGFAAPRVAVAALNPHGGDGGTCGREEIDIIAPAAMALNDEGLPIEGPYPADTIFLRARDGKLDAIVTMYHDQGQIAVKLMGFERGVTVQGGLPVPITTPAHGTAFDISGTGRANPTAMIQAFLMAAQMARA